jgi:hypothetical protein
MLASPVWFFVCLWVLISSVYSIVGWLVCGFWGVFLLVWGCCGWVMGECGGGGVGGGGQADVCHIHMHT